MIHKQLREQGKQTYARSTSIEVPGWRDTKRLESASIWSKERLTEGRSVLDKCDVKFFDEANNENKSAAIS